MILVLVARLDGFLRPPTGDEVDRGGRAG